MFPLRRNRRLRANESIRSLVRETIISPNDFLVPLFVVEGKGVKEEIASMPNYYRLSLDHLSKEVKELWSLGLKSVLLFVKVDDKLKDNKGTEALNPNGLMQRAIKTVKDACPEMLVMTDVALDPFSVYGHDGIIHDGEILNDETNSVLAEMSLSHAKAGADFVEPSDMMDGRIFEIRALLEDEGFHNIGIMSYSAKYASAFYGPFR
ncbi:MAG: porphobilinogen synthase, partial [Flavobacteriales bacterium]|nr:porphobilinogen synthase [Flavobacteriales bacterium]